MLDIYSPALTFEGTFTFICSYHDEIMGSFDRFERKQILSWSHSLTLCTSWGQTSSKMVLWTQARMFIFDADLDQPRNNSVAMVLLLLFYFSVFLGLHVQNVGVPRRGVGLEW